MVYIRFQGAAPSPPDALLGTRRIRMPVWRVPYLE